MDNYSTADQLDYYPEGDFPGKQHSGWQRLGQVLSLGGYNPDNRALGAENEKITKAKTALKVQGAEAAMKAESARTENAKNIQAFAQNLVQFTGMDKVEALKLATEHYQEQSALAAQSAQNENAKNKAKGAAPFMANVGAAGAQDDLVAKKANRSRNEGGLRESEASNKLGAPETNALTNSTAAKKKLAQEQGGLATAIDQNSTDELTRALKDPAAEQKYLKDQQLIKQLQAAGGVAGAKMQNQQTTADAAALAGDIQSGTYDTNRRAALDRASTMILPQGGLAVRADGSRIENPMYFSTIRNTDADGNTKVSGIRGREYQGTADPVAQPIQTPADPGVIRIPRRSLLNPNQQ